MLFNSLTFLIFLCIVLSIYYIMPHKYRWYILLISSFIFYMAWRVEFIFLILFSSILNYILGLILEKNSKKYILGIGLIINFLILIIFKYSIFISDTFRYIYDLLGISYPIKEFDILLPMGISFYTFQATSYIIDVYKKRYKAEKNVLKLTLYIMFFPQLVAGPIERADRLMGEIFKRHYFNVNNISLGIKIMIIGYFKKVVIADRVAILVNSVYNNPYDNTSISFIIATVFFAIQLYCDFSGYSDIARGSAKLFGIDLMENFKNPYLSKNIKEFWATWHISLSSWFKDYLYIPLGGNKRGHFRKYINILITFLVSGLWHGANFTFVIWGGINGIYQIVGDIKYRILGKKQLNNSFFDIFRVIITFGLVCFSLIFFRANTVGDAFFIIQNIIPNTYTIQHLYDIITGFSLNVYEILFVSLCIIYLLIIEIFEKNERIYIKLEKKNILFRYIFYYILIIIILSKGVFTDAGQFIYFQF